MYFKYPEIELYNISHPFYNDICNIYTSEVNTDMSLNDRRSEYFVNISLCENNCYLVKILNKDLKNPRSLCNCDIKKEFMYNNKANNNYTIPKISTYNSKAVKCISQAFNKNSISSNPIFWIFIIVLLFLIILLIRWIFYGSKEIRRILKISKPNQDDSKIKISSESNEISEINDISKNNSLNNKEDLNLKNKQKKDLAKSMGIPDNNKKRLSNNEIDSQKIEYLSAPLEQSAPPKKKIKRNQSLVTKAENKSDELISNSEPSFFKNSIIKPNEKDNTDISFENLPYDNQIYIDNLLKQRKMLENNYLKNPIEYERFQKMEIMRNSLYNLEDIEQKKYCNSCEDIYCPKNKKTNGNANINVNLKGKEKGIENNKNLDININKNKKERNKMIIKLLDAESLFDNESELNNKKKLSDKNDEKKLKNNKEKKMKLKIQIILYLKKKKHLKEMNNFFSLVEFLEKMVKIY
jgi:hypothetical protein